MLTAQYAAACCLAALLVAAWVFCRAGRWALAGAPWPCCLRRPAAIVGSEEAEKAERRTTEKAAGAGIGGVQSKRPQACCV